MQDLRDDIFKSVMTRSVTADVIAEDTGVLAGIQAAEDKAKSLGLDIIQLAEEGQIVQRGDVIAKVSGNPKQIAVAEDQLIGLVAKPSGIATATRNCVDRAGPDLQIVCGAWKKMPLVLKQTIRDAIVTGGGYFRISRDPFIYLDKNYIQMLGGIKSSLQAVAHFAGFKKVVQIKGRQKDITLEACEAAELSADIIYVDSGQPQDLREIADLLNRKGLRDRVKIAFGGSVKIEDIDRFKDLPVDILEIGRQIVDAPLLDFKLEVVEIKEN
jgi:nicotinate-nucleotide pyrophosphorylase (carboxylating)